MENGPALPAPLVVGSAGARRSSANGLALQPVTGPGGPPAGVSDTPVTLAAGAPSRIGAGPATATGPVVAAPNLSSGPGVPPPVTSSGGRADGGGAPAPDLVASGRAVPAPGPAARALAGGAVPAPPVARQAPEAPSIPDGALRAARAASTGPGATGSLPPLTAPAPVPQAAPGLPPAAPPPARPVAPGAERAGPVGALPAGPEMVRPMPPSPHAPAGNGALPVPSLSAAFRDGAAPAPLSGDVSALALRAAEGVGGPGWASQGTPAATGHSAPFPPPPAAQAIAQQVIRGLAQGASATAPVEISLDPPELGRVRLAMLDNVQGPVLSITADRPETADLMRRHLGLLSEEFARAGLDAPGVQIGDRDTARHGRDQGADATRPAASRPDRGAETGAPGPAAGTPGNAADGGLDLRL